MFPNWDSVISAMEIASSNQHTSRNRHISRSSFCRALSRAGIRFPRSSLLKLLEHLDPGCSDEIDWVKFVEVNDPPYFFNGRIYFYVRQFFQLNWRSILISSKDLEASSRKSNAQLKGCLGLDDFKAVVHKTLMTSMLFHSADQENMWPNIIDLLNTFQGGDSSNVVHYENFLAHYAGESAMAEYLLSRKWESIWTDLGGTWGVVDPKGLERVLKNPKVFLFFFVKQLFL